MGRLAAVLAVVGVALVSLPTARAHTVVLDVQPGPGAVVDGTVDRIVVEFLDPVLPTPDIEVVGPGDVPVVAEATRLVSETVVEQTFAPLTEEGPYRVRYEFASTDGDVQVETHQFTYTGATPKPTPTTSSTGGGTSGPGARTVLAVVAGLVVVALLVGAVRSRPTPV